MINCESVRFKNRGEVEEILDKIKRIAETYGAVSLEDYKGLCDIKADYMDTKYGWLEHEIEDSVICRDYYGYFINLPKPTLIHIDQNDTPKYTPFASKPSHDPELSTLNIVLHTNEVSDPDATLTEIFKHIQTIKDRMINISIM